MRRITPAASSARGRMNTTRCNQTGKASFRCELDAKIALAGRIARDKGEKRYYSCRSCHGWHLTSQPKTNGKVAA